MPVGQREPDGPAKPNPLGESKKRGLVQSPHSHHTVATQSPLQSPLENTVVATELKKRKV